MERQMSEYFPNTTLQFLQMPGLEIGHFCTNTTPSTGIGRKKHLACHKAAILAFKCCFRLLRLVCQPPALIFVIF